MKGLDIRQLVLCCLLLLPFGASAQDADTVVEKMVSAMNNLSYQGTYVYLHGDQVETIKLTHTNENGNQHETLLSLNGEAREIIRSNNTVYCILPSQQAIIIDKARTQFSGINKLTFYSNALKQFYTFRLLGDDRIAGKKAYVVHIEPNDEYRYAHTLWIDKKDYLLLKTKISDANNQTIEQLVFTEIEVMDEPGLMPIKAITDSRFTQLTTIENKVKEFATNKSNWNFENVPTGYKLKQYFKKTLSKNGKEIKQWLFSDGLISYSVFIEKMDKGQDMPNNMITMGSVNVYSTTYNNFAITVMGEVPAKTIMMASSGISKS